MRVHVCARACVRFCVCTPTGLQSDIWFEVRIFVVLLLFPFVLIGIIKYLGVTGADLTFNGVRQVPDVEMWEPILVRLAFDSAAMLDVRRVAASGVLNPSAYIKVGSTCPWYTWKWSPPLSG